MFRIMIRLALLAAVAFAVAKVLQGRRSAELPTVGPTESWPRLQPDPAASSSAGVPTSTDPVAAAGPVSEAAAELHGAAVAAWVEPKGENCPQTHPVKAKLSSKIYHLPGMRNYERTNPDRCYRDAEAAEADGLRAAKS
jgi:hypothetical protein